jgi:hypothetical protein
MSPMSDQPVTMAVLTRFHRDVLLPDVERVVERVVGALEQRMDARFDAVYGHFDAVYSRFEVFERDGWLCARAQVAAGDSAGCATASRVRLRGSPDSKRQ